MLGTPDAMSAAANWYRANPLPSDTRVGPITVPTLYIWGTDDVAFHRTAAEATSTMINADYRFVELEGHGHWLPETASTEILPYLFTHLER